MALYQDRTGLEAVAGVGMSRQVTWRLRAAVLSVIRQEPEVAWVLMAVYRGLSVRVSEVHLFTSMVVRAPREPRAGLVQVAHITPAQELSIVEEAAAILE